MISLVKKVFGLTGKGVPERTAASHEVEGQTLTFIRRWLADAERHLKDTGFYDRYPLNEFWGKLNVPSMLDILRASSSDEEVLRRIQELNCFIVSFPGETTEKAADLHIRHLREHNPELWNLLCDIGESPVVSEHLKIKREGGKFTTDTFRIAQIAWRIFSLSGLKRETRLTFFELGAGLGHLCRFITCMAPKSVYIIADLPISLCFSYLFIKNSFPQKKILLLEAGQELTPAMLSEYDIVFTAVSVIDSVRTLPVDVFINTCSLGEMINEVSQSWVSYVQNTLKPKFIYSLNRFLNHIDDTDDYRWRKRENGYSIHAFPAFEVRSFTLEDKHLFGPYFDCLHPRYLELGMFARVPVHADNTAILAADMLAQFWLKYYASNSWTVNYRSSDLCNDLTMSGTLYACWDNARSNPGALSYLLLLVYMDHLNRDNCLPFEESFYLEDRLSHSAKELPAGARSSVEGYLASRRDWRKNYFKFKSAKERNGVTSQATGVIELLLQAASAVAAHKTA